MTLRLFLALFFLSILSLKSRGQDPQVDSLKRILETATDSHRVDVLLALSDAHYQVAGQLHTMLTYAALAQEQSQVLGYRKGQIMGLLRTADYHRFEGNKLTLFNVLQEVDSLLDLSPQVPAQARSLRLQASLYKSIDLSQALALQFQALALIDSAEITRMRTPTLLELAGILHQAKDLDGTRKYLELCRDQAYREDDRATLGAVFALLGGLTYAEDSIRALELLHQAEQNLGLVSNHRELSSLLLNVGIIHGMHGDLPAARQYFERALAAHPHPKVKATILFNLGMVHGLLGDLELEIAYYDSSRVTAEDAKDRDRQMHALTGLADLYHTAGRYAESVDCLVQCLALKDSATQETIQSQLALQEAVFKQQVQRRKIQALQQKAETQTYQFWLIVLAGLLLTVTLALAGSLLYRKRERRYVSQVLQHKAKIQTMQEVREAPPTTASNSVTTTIPVVSGSKVLIKNLSDLACFQADASLVFAVDQQGARFVVDHTLTELEHNLPEDFLRIHRSHIVNKTRIRSLKRLESNRFQFTMETEKELVLNSGRAYRDRIRAALQV